MWRGEERTRHGHVVRTGETLTDAVVAAARQSLKLLLASASLVVVFVWPPHAGSACCHLALASSCGLVWFHVRGMAPPALSVKTPCEMRQIEIGDGLCPGPRCGSYYPGALPMPCCCRPRVFYLNKLVQFKEIAVF